MNIGRAGRDVAYREVVALLLPFTNARRIALDLEYLATRQFCTLFTQRPATEDISWSTLNKICVTWRTLFVAVLTHCSWSSRTWHTSLAPLYAHRGASTLNNSASKADTKGGRDTSNFQVGSVLRKSKYLDFEFCTLASARLL